ncbi:MAG: hypothetical protein JWM32_564 [Verrucomicrobia bacterium]|nr:hypothetical protein [Verrucomicrobiota bacterium]
MPEASNVPDNDPNLASIAVMGTPVTSGNRGVLALGASVLNLCDQAAPGQKLTLLLLKKDNTPAEFRVGGKLQQISIVNARRSPKSKPREHIAWVILMAMIHRLIPLRGVRAAIENSTPWIKTIARARFVGDIHGGDSFSDIYGLPRLIENFLMDWTVLLVKGTMVQFPQTYGPYKRRSARWMAAHLLKHSSVIIARDKESQRIAQDLVGPDKQVLLSPDVAFSLESVRPEKIELDPPLTGPIPSGVIGLNVNGLMYHGGYTRKNMFGLKMDYASFLPDVVTALLQVHPGELWLVPHTFAADGNVESDPEASRKLRALLPEALRSRVRIINRAYDQYEIKGVIAQCEFFVGSRMHACIAALSQGVPCVGVAYSMKFAGVFESVGMRDWVIDGRTASNAEAVARVVQLYHERNAVKSALKSRADDARAQLRRVFQQLVETHPVA